VTLRARSADRVRPAPDRPASLAPPPHAAPPPGAMHRPAPGVGCPAPPLLLHRFRPAAAPEASCRTTGERSPPPDHPRPAQPVRRHRTRPHARRARTRAVHRAIPQPSSPEPSPRDLPFKVKRFSAAGGFIASGFAVKIAPQSYKGNRAVQDLPQMGRARTQRGGISWRLR